jgi:hypothetical protein
VRGERGDVDPGNRLRARFRAHLGAKMVVWVGLTIGICVPYFGLQRLDVLGLQRLDPFSTWLVPETALDRAVPFEPRWIWPYVSVAVLVAIAPLMATSQIALRRYSVGLALLCTTCFAVFLFFPVAGPRPSVLPDLALYRFLVSVDRPTNSLPSLHVGLVVYSLLYCDRVLRAGTDPGRLAVLRVLGAVWGVAILYSTLATKQHWAVDLPPAIVIAYGAYAFAWRRAD